jgi:energy-converting hydrogenase Eha subunit E
MWQRRAAGQDSGIAGTGGSRRLHEMSGSAGASIALVQGVFYVATGVWALVDLDSFMAVTGPKVDHWLVKTVGVLVTVIGAVLLFAARNHRVTPEIVVLAVGSALSLAAIDVVYVSAGRISSIYLLDAAAEVGLAAAWAVARRRG